MAQQSRADLKIKFSDGKRPSGSEFADLLDSFINPQDDSIQKDANGNYLITLGDGQTNKAGTLRFTGGKVQFFDGAAWQDVGTGSSGGFQAVGGTQNIAYSNGNVGINTAAAQPTARLEVALAVGEQVKLGSISIGNSAATNNGFVQVSHVNRANDTDYALRQGPQGNVNLNAPANQKLILSKAGNVPRLSVIENGSVIVAGTSDISTFGAEFQVNGKAFKNDGTATWNQPSDARLKKEIRPFMDGLEKLLQINPVNFKYNGLAQTTDNQEQVGILAQEMAKILPYTVSTASAQFQPNDAPTDMLTFNPNALIYVLINSVKELANKVQSLEKELAGK